MAEGSTPVSAWLQARSSWINCVSSSLAFARSCISTPNASTAITSKSAPIFFMRISSAMKREFDRSAGRSRTARGEERANPLQVSAEDRARFSFYSVHAHLESEDSTCRNSLKIRVTSKCSLRHYTEFWAGTCIPAVFRSFPQWGQNLSSSPTSPLHCGQEGCRLHLQLGQKLKRAPTAVPHSGQG